MFNIGSRVLDLGGHKLLKRGLFDIEQYHLKVIYANISNTNQPDVQADASYIPFQANCFNGVICSELLEHVFSPPTILNEIYRILANDGILLATVPFLYRIHDDPYDFGRYTFHYWKTTLNQIGFHSIEIEHQGLFFSVIVDFIKQYAAAEHWYKRRIYYPFIRAISFAQHWALREDQKSKYRRKAFLKSFTTGFGIKAIK